MIARSLFCLITALALAGAAVPARAASSGTDTTATSTAKKKKSSAAKTQKSHTVKFIKSPSQESSAERERRLKRECKGRPNAGACLGYAS